MYLFNDQANQLIPDESPMKNSECLIQYAVFSIEKSSNDSNPSTKILFSWDELNTLYPLDFNQVITSSQPPSLFQNFSF